MNKKIRIRLTQYYKEVMSKPYLDPFYFMIRCPKCNQVVDKRKHKHIEAEGK